MRALLMNAHCPRTDKRLWTPQDFGARRPPLIVLSEEDRRTMDELRAQREAGKVDRAKLPSWAQKEFDAREQKKLERRRK